MDRYAMIRGLEPQAVLRCFWEFSQVPRIPGDMEPASDFLASFIRALGLEVWQDGHHNVIARKPASKGYEEAPVVMLQAHMDMVCEKSRVWIMIFAKTRSGSWWRKGTRSQRRARPWGLMTGWG